MRLRSRHAGVLVSILLSLLLFGGIATAQSPGWSKASHASSADPDYEIVFPSSGVLLLEIAIVSENRTGAETNPHVHDWLADVRFEDRVWEDVVVMVPRGAWEEWQREAIPFPLHLRFASEQRPEQRFYGFRELGYLLASNELVRDLVTLESIREAGIPTPRAALSVISLSLPDASSMEAVYTLVETPGPSLLDSQYDEDDGALYAIEGESATFSVFDPHAAVLLHPADDEWSPPPPSALFDVLQWEPQDLRSWRMELERIFDVYEFLRWLATRTVLGASWGYGRSHEPVLLYWDPGDARYHWVPGVEMGALMSSEASLPPFALDGSDIEPEWRLLHRVIEDPAYFGTYLAYVEESLRGVLDVPRLQGRITEAFAALGPALERAASSPDSRLPSIEAATQAADRLSLAVEKRYADVDGFIWDLRVRPSPIIISELHYNPSLAQGIDNNFEFVELFNRGSRTIDLSGYRFIEGLEFALPPGTVLRPGQCLLLTKRAETYRDAPCEVQQWARGSLSNGGEVVRLVDREGIEVDSVRYDDVSPWPEAADSGGSSLEIVDPHRPNYTHENWRASEAIGGSPGWIER